MGGMRKHLVYSKCHDIYSMGLSKKTKPKFRIAGIRAETQTRGLPNTE